MVDVVPFQGFLYDENKAGPLAQLIAPPYDVIKPPAQDALYEKNPHNIVRLILGKQFPEDGEGDNRYTRSAATFAEWIDNGILARDAEPGFYLYSQRYEYEGRQVDRSGFFARVRLEDFSAGNICPHEFTLAKAKQDRTQLLRACRANFSPIFGLFSDAGGEVDAALAAPMEREPLASIEEDGVAHRFWRLQDAALTASVAKMFRDKKIYIADGHHRYETALAYHKENGDRVPDSAHVMMFLTNLDSPNLAVYAIHRQVKCPQAFDREAFIARAKEFFDLDSMDADASPESVKSALEAAGKEGIAFCVYLGKGSLYLMKVKDPDRALEFFDPGESPELKVLDAAQLHTLAIREILGVDAKKPEDQARLSYTIHIDEAMANIDAGKFDVAFFMNHTPAAQVRDLAERGVRLPQKSTYFYPKLLSGLVINRFEP